MNRIYITSEGYTAGQRDDFERDKADAMLEVFGDDEVGRALQLARLHTIFTPSDTSGTTGGGRFASRFESDGDLRLDMQRVSAWRRDNHLSPGDALVILVNSARHGGAFQSLTNTVYYSARGPRAVDVLKHELLGHLIGRCGDEYGGRPRYPETGGGPDAPNLSILSDPSRVPWAAFVGQDDGMGGAVGVYEGGGGFDRGVFRPTRSSKMRALGKPFGPVVRAAILRGLARFTPADSAPLAGDLNGDGCVDFSDLNLALESGEFGAVNDVLGNFGRSGEGVIA